VHAHDKREGQVVVALRQEIFDPLDDNGDGVLVRCVKVALSHFRSMSCLMHLRLTACSTASGRLLSHVLERIMQECKHGAL
jgi:hypothetical protein